MSKIHNRSEFHGSSLGQTVIQKKVNDLVPYIQNARTHDKEQVSLLADSIREFGFNNPILLDGKNGVIAGHGRLMAARVLKMTHVPCIELKHLTESQKRAYILADNQIALRSAWNDEMLKSELAALEAEGVDMKLLGFADKELKALMDHPSVTKTEEDDIPVIPETPVSLLGDTWILGVHRVRCGDSTSAKHVSALLKETKPHLMVTDPPYGVNYDPTWRDNAGGQFGNGKTKMRGKVQNDNRSDWREAWGLFPGNIAYVWHGAMHSHLVADSLLSCDFALRGQIIWVKPHFIMSRGDYHWQHEPCWYAVKGTGKWCGNRKQTTVWEIGGMNPAGRSQDPADKDKTNHGTQKPVECMRRPILNNSVKGDAVYDPFLGSGTTLIAAETEQRQCFGMELSPAYVDMIVKRWQNFTGKTATLEATGQSFAEVANGRNS